MAQYDAIYMEREENYIKQTYRNRCVLAAANGPLTLSVPIVKPDELKCPTKDIRISDHGNWRHLHWNALVSAYNMSPFFEYYADDFAPFYERRFTFLFDFNEALRLLRMLIAEASLLPTTLWIVELSETSYLLTFDISAGLFVKSTLHS